MIQLAKIPARMTKALMRCKPIAKLSAKLSRNKPEILVISGGIMILTAFGWAIYEAVTMKDVLEETSDRVKAVEAEYETRKAACENGPEVEKIEKEYRKELTVTRAKGAAKVGGRFVGPMITLMVGMGCGFQSVRILRARNIFLGTAVKGYQEFIKFYRGNVKEDLGEAADFKYAHGVIGEKTIERTEKDKDGNEVKTSYTLPVLKGDDRKDHLDESNPWRFVFSEDWFDSWKENTDLNLFFLKCEQEWWNYEFNACDSVSMYEVLKHLRFNFKMMQEHLGKRKYAKWEHFVRNWGWKKGSGGDGFIDLGLYRAINEPAIKRQTDVIFIEMNCDGPICEGELPE